jgi:hypothetical protein
MVAAALLGALALASSASAAGPVSIAADPSVTDATTTVRVFGRIASGRPGETVQVEMSECGGTGWRVFNQARTTSLGAWSATLFAANVTTKVRARWGKATSNVATVRVRPFIFTDNNHHRRLLVQVRASDYFPRALLQRRSGNRWVRYRTIALGRGDFGSTADLHVNLPRGTRVRILLTQAQVGRCYLPAQTTTVVT